MDIDFNDIDDIITAEEKVSKKSFDEGYERGIQQGKIEGTSMGREHGKRAAKEFGEQYGFSVVMLQVLTRKTKLKQGEQQAARRMQEIVRSAGEVGKYENGFGNLSQFHDLLQRNKRRFEEARKFLKVRGDNGRGSPREDRFSF